MSVPQVYILTWCQRIELLYGATLVFKTLRDGFPNARVHVADSASIPAAREEIRRAAKECQAEFEQLSEHTELYDFIHRVLENQRDGSAVFVDPDICFWEPVEEWQFDNLAAGRFIPRHVCDFTHCLTEPRLHTSLLFFSDVARLRAAIEQVRQSRRFFEPFRSVMVPITGRWHFFDNTAGLYGALPDEMRHFEERQLNAYDHLFAGSFGDSVFKMLQSDFAEAYRNVHVMAQSDCRLIKGCWRQQDEYFQARKISEQY